MWPAQFSQPPELQSSTNEHFATSFESFLQQEKWELLNIVKFLFGFVFLVSLQHILGSLVGLHFILSGPRQPFIFRALSHLRVLLKIMLTLYIRFHFYCNFNNNNKHNDLKKKSSYPPPSFRVIFCEPDDKQPIPQNN